MSLFGGVIFTLYFVGHLDLKGFLHKDQLRLVGFFALAAALGIAISAIQLVPSFEFFTNTPRNFAVTYQDATAGSLSPADFLMSFIPEYNGSPLSGTFRGHNAFWEICVFIGIFPVLAALLAPFVSPAVEKRRVAVFALMAVLGILLASGRNTPVYHLLVKIPVVGSFRIPARFMVLTITALTYFLTLALDQLPGAYQRLEKSNRKWLVACLGLSGLALALLTLVYLRHGLQGIKTGFIYFAVTGFGGLVLLSLGVFGKLPELVCRLIALVLLAVTPIPVAVLWNPTAPGGYYASRSAPFHPAADRKPPVRVHYYPPVQMKDTLNLPATRKVSNVLGYNPMGLTRYLEYLIYSDFGRPLDIKISRSLTRNGNIFGLHNPNRQMIRLLNVSLDYRFRKVDRGFAINARLVPNSFPRAFLAEKAVVIPDKLEILKALRTGRYDPRQVVLLSEKPPADVKDSPVLIDGNEAESVDREVKVLEYLPDRIRLAVNTDRPRWLFMSEIYYPGWKALVDGEPVKVYRANHIFRAVPVPGRCQVTFYFKPGTVKVGAIFTLMGLVFVVWVMVFSYIRRQQSRPR